MNLVQLFTDTANAIREKDGTTDKIIAEDFPDRIRAISVESPTETEYTKLEYIESTGTQYIDTGAYPDRYMSIELKYRKTGNIEYALEAPFGCRQAGYNFTFWDKSNNSNTTKATQIGNLDYQEWEISNTNFNIDTKIKLTHNFYTLEFNNQTYTMERNNYSLGFSTFSAYLFANRNKDGSMDSPCSMRLYSCKIFYRGDLYRDFVPCKDPSGVVCLYDKVSNSYFYNKGTGNFISE